MHGHILYIIIHVYECLCMFYVYLYIFIHEKFFTECYKNKYHIYMIN